MLQSVIVDTELSCCRYMLAIITLLPVTTMKLSHLIFACCSLLLAACSSAPQNAGSQTPQPLSQQFCDSYFIYNMCARDVDADGEVDLMYFTDTNEIFMLWPDTDIEPIEELSAHRCMQVNGRRNSSGGVSTVYHS